MSSTRKVLLFGGIDPTGHAGIYRDMEMCNRLQQEFFTIPTALTAQTDGIYLGDLNLPVLYQDQLAKLVNPEEVGSIKIGMLRDLNTAGWVTGYITRLKEKNPNIKVVWDPVMRASSGGRLLTDEALAWCVEKLFPLLGLITPNAKEACYLLKQEGNEQMDGRALAMDFFEKYKTPVLLKGGHLQTRSIDWLVTEDGVLEFKEEVSEKNVRGTGCLLSSAIATFWTQGFGTVESCQKAKDVVRGYFNF